jgi:hypothetical protein
MLELSYTMLFHLIIKMGAPTSSILSEIYLQFLENNRICKILTKHNIKGFFHYVDDILIVSDVHQSNIEDKTKVYNRERRKLEDQFSRFNYP